MDYKTVQPRADDRPRVVHAGNFNSEMWVGVGSLIVLVAISVITWWVVRDVLRDAANIQNDWATVAAIVFALGVFSFVGRYVLLIVNGDYAAVREIDQAERTERQRVRAAKSAAMAAINLEAEKERNRHTEAIRADDTERMRINTSHQLDMVNHRLSLIEERTERGVIPRPTDAPSFVPSRARPALSPARQFAEKLYGLDGAPNADKVHANGTLIRGVPWSKKSGAWNSEQWGDDAARLLTTTCNGLEPLILPIHDSNGGVRGYRLNVEEYPTSTDLLRLMDHMTNSPH